MQHVVAHDLLLPYQGLHQALYFLIIVLFGNAHRAGNDKRRSRFVDKDRVHFVDDGVIVAALHHFFLAHGHAIVTQIVEAKFAVRSVGDVAIVLDPSFRGIHLVLNAADGYP